MTSSLKTKLEQHMVYLILVCILIIAQLFSPGYLAPTHLAGILRLSSFMGIAAIGQTLVILTGGIDLSVAATITLANVMGAQIMMGNNQNIPLAIVVVVLIGIVIGIANGIGIQFLRIPPFIMTLGVGCVVQGLYMIYTNGAPKGNTAPFLSTLCNESVGGLLSGIVVAWAVLSVFTIVMLKKTPVGRYIYSVGSNKTASRFSGIATEKVIFIVYILSSVMAALAGFFLVGYTGTSYLDVGATYVNGTIAAVIIGGTAITGGKGGYVGTIAGAITMTVLNDLLVIVDIPQAGRQMAQGAIIILLVLLYAREKARNH